VRVLIFLLVMGSTWWLVNRLDAAPQGVRVDGSQVVVQTDDVEATFRRLTSASGSYMVFGGNNDQQRNSMVHALVAGLPMLTARAIHASYPDFHRCASPGAAQAKQSIESLQMIGTTRAARDALIEAVDLHDERIRSGGDRTCLTFSGAELMLDSIRLRHDGQDVTHEVGRLFGNSRFFLAEQVELPDCVALLR
jgi:hypothetical protein